MNELSRAQLTRLANEWGYTEEEALAHFEIFKEVTGAALSSPQADKVPAAEGASDPAKRQAMSELVSQPWYDLAWKHGATQSVSFAGDELEALTFSPDQFDAFCDDLATPQPTRAGAVELTAEEIRGAIARGYCHQTNAKKVLDYDLLDAIAQEVCSLIAAATTAATGEKEQS